MDFRLFQLFVRVGFESKELLIQVFPKREQGAKDYRLSRATGGPWLFLNPEASVYREFSRLSAADVETWAAEHDYRIVDQQIYMETWGAFTEQDSTGEGRVFCFIESIPKNYEVEELQHAAAYRLWILFESGCGLDLNAQVKDVISPAENRKKEPIKHFDQYRFITNNESFRQHLSTICTTTRMR